jgi:integrase
MRGAVRDGYIRKIPSVDIRLMTSVIRSPVPPWPRACPSEVSRWLGHKSITTTVDLYGHLVPEASGRARDALDKAFAGTRVCAPMRPGCY